MAKLLVVVGATGNQGSSVINAVLQHDPSYKIRGITRDTSTAASKALSAKGVEMVVADRYNVLALRIAFKGATAIFAITDFWQPYLKALAAHAGLREVLVAPRLNFNSARRLAEEDEIDQGRKMVNAACGLDTLEHFILSSLPDAHAISGGKLDMLANSVGKARTLKYLQGLDKPFHPSHAGNHEGKTLWRKTTVLWVGYYMENWINLPYSRPKQTGDGTYTIRTAFPPDTPISLTAVADIGRYVSSLLATGAAAHPVLAVSDRRTMAQMTATLAAATGKTITYEQVSAEHFEMENPSLGLMLAQMMAYMAEYGFCGDDAKTIGAEELGVRHLTSFERFVSAKDWSSFCQK
ncbi:MAG: hypothetical protein LQ345_004401 [Seirophora villosa]|nr:MAG: hypothetical protein LQ345_004401 [Seirophora villosa]